MDEGGEVLLGRSREGIDKDRLTVPIGYLLPFESMSDAAKRLVFEWARVDVKPKDVLFICEAIDQRKEVR
jgi:ADP-ribose pyrophosphatase YjhB (NUDIX family)